MNLPFQSGSLQKVSRFQLADCVAALRWIFLGMAFCAFHLRVNRFDFLDNTVGMVLIVVGLATVVRLPVTGTFKAGVDFAFYTAWVGLIHSIVDRFGIRWERPFTLVRELVNCAYPIAIFLFCNAMRDFCRQANLSRSASSWQVTTWLFAVVYIVPLLIIRVLSFGHELDGRRFDFHVRNEAAFLMLIAMAVPLIHFYISTSRMKREGIWGMGR